MQSAKLLITNTHGSPTWSSAGQSTRVDRRRASGLRRLVETLVLVAIACVFLDRVMAIGLLPIGHIVGDSMAPTLLGDHWQITCPDCDIVFRVSAKRSAADTTVCPNCGHYGPQAFARLGRSGQRVWIDPFYQWIGKSLRRGQLIAIRQPKKTMAVKRLVGLPGEHVEFVDGDLRVDGKWIRKSIDSLRQLAILVHDDRHRPSQAGRPSRWQPRDRSHTGWSIGHQGFRHCGEFLDGKEIDWLAYHHQKGWPPDHRWQPAPITDSLGINQHLTDAGIVTYDLYLQATLEFARHTGEIWLGGHDGHQPWSCRWSLASGDCQLFCREQSVANGPARCSTQRTSHLIEWVLCDRQIVLAIDGRITLQHSYEKQGQATPVSTPLQIGVRGLPASLDKLKVFRDLVLLAPDAQSATWDRGVRLENDEYLVLGDNSPVSIDSRHWPRGSIRHHDVVGPVRSLFGP